MSAVLRYRTDFEDVTKVDVNHLDLGLPSPLNHHFNFQGWGGARIWMEGGFAHSGARCLGTELFDITKSRRIEFNIQYIDQLLGDRWGVSSWHYLPPEFRLDSPTNKWINLQAPYAIMKSPWHPRIEWGLFGQPDGGYTLRAGYTDPDSVNHRLTYIRDYPFPIGRQFRVRYHLYKHPTEGWFKLWIDDDLVCGPPDWTGLRLTGAPNKITILKLYHATDDRTPKKHYMDDLKLWSGFPTVDEEEEEEPPEPDYVVEGLISLALEVYRRRS